MPHTPKWLLLFALYILMGSALSACAFPQVGGNELRATLSVLETKSAQLEETAVPQKMPTTPSPNVPLTGGAETEVVATGSPLPALVASLTPAPLQPDGAPTSDVPTAQISPTLECPTHESKITLSAPKTMLKVGEVIEVKALLENTGCVTLGLPQYRLAILNSEGKPIFSPDKPDPVVHSLGVTPGQSDEVTYLLQAVSPGKATLSVMTSFEVHLGYPGPAYWGAGSSKELVIQVEP